MACHGYLRLEGRNYLIEYIVKNSTYPITGVDDPKGDPAINAAAPSPDVRVMCRNILNAFSSTIEGMDEVEQHISVELQQAGRSSLLVGSLAIADGIPRS